MRNYYKRYPVRPYQFLSDSHRFMGFLSTPEPGQAVGTIRKSFNVGLASTEKSGRSWNCFK